MTAQVARAAFPKGCPAIRIRDALGELFDDGQFAGLFATRGRPALSPARLALVSVLQFAEGLSDRQAADAVRGRIDWKYALGLELADTGFDASVLSEFRARLAVDDQAERLLGQMLARLREQRLLARGGRQRTDATHVLAAVRELNRLELVTETLRAALEALAAAAPSWLITLAPDDWYERYGQRARDWRLPRPKRPGPRGRSLSAPMGSPCWKRSTTPTRQRGCGRSRRSRPCGWSGSSSPTATRTGCAGAARGSCHLVRWRSAARMTPMPATGSSAGWAGAATRPTSPRPASPTGPT
jgi:transposase